MWTLLSFFVSTEIRLKKYVIFTKKCNLVITAYAHYYHFCFNKNKTETYAISTKKNETWYSLRLKKDAILVHYRVLVS